MKKMLAILLAVALVASLCTTAFAADAAVAKNDELGTSSADANYNTFDESTGKYIVFATDDTASTTQDVTIKIADPHFLVEEYDVTIEFGALHFEYSWGTNPIWDEDKHIYVADPTNSGWADDSRDIVVTNHSNRAVDVSALFGNNTKTVTKDNVTVAISNADKTLKSADDPDYYDSKNADALTYTVTVSGEPDSKTDAGADFDEVWVIETITISLANTTDQPQP